MRKGRRRRGEEGGNTRKGRREEPWGQKLKKGKKWAVGAKSILAYAMVMAHSLCCYFQSCFHFLDFKPFFVSM